MTEPDILILVDFESNNVNESGLIPRLHDPYRDSENSSVRASKWLGTHLTTSSAEEENLGITEQQYLPSLSHPNYRHLNWGQDEFLNQRRLDSFAFGMNWLGDKTPTKPSKQRSDQLTNKELEKLEAYYRGLNAVPFCYHKLPFVYSSSVIKRLHENLSRMLGSAAIRVNDQTYLKKVQHRIEELDARKARANSLARAERPSKRRGHSARKSGSRRRRSTKRTGRDNALSPASTEEGTSSDRLQSITAVGRLVEAEEAAETGKAGIKAQRSSPGSLAQLLPIDTRYRAMQELYFRPHHETDSVSRVLNRFMPHTKEQITLMYDLANDAIDALATPPDKFHTVNFKVGRAGHDE